MERSVETPRPDPIRERLRGWIEQFGRYADPEKLLRTYHRLGGGEAVFTLHTAEHVYRIRARIGEQTSYLGCQVSNRAWRPGEDWHRGTDLTDGPFSEETWNRIVLDIVGYELKEPVPPPSPEPVVGD